MPLFIHLLYGVMLEITSYSLSIFLAIKTLCVLKGSSQYMSPKTKSLQVVFDFGMDFNNYRFRINSQGTLLISLLMTNSLEPYLRSQSAH
jgi:hypothetical protein